MEAALYVAGPESHGKRADRGSGALTLEAAAPCLGLGLFFAINNFFLWGVSLPFVPADPAVGAMLVSVFRVGAAVSIALSSILAGAASLLLRRYAYSGLIVFAVSSVLIFVAWVLFLFSSLTASPGLSVLGGVLTGLSHAVFFVLWGTVLARNDFRTNLLCLLVAGVLSASMNIGFSLLPYGLSSIAMGAVLVPAVWLLGVCLRRAARPGSGSDEQVRAVPSAQGRKALAALRDMARPLTCVGALGFSFNAVREVAFSDFGLFAPVNTLSFLGLLTGTAALFVITVSARSSMPRIEQLYPPIALSLSAMLILVPFAGLEYRAVFNVIMGAVYPLAATLMFASFARIARERGASAVFVFGIGSGLVDFATGAGSLACQALGAGHGAMETLSVAMVAFLALYLLTFSLALTRGRAQRRPSAPPAPAGVREGCDRIADRYGVTAGEKSVMVLLAQGFTVSAIAERLQLSPNTVRSHSKAIYRKLGVHSKQELIDLVSK